jgi:hypothetical protein
MQRYHPQATGRTSQGTTLTLTNQQTLPPCLTDVIHATFDTTCELFAIPLNNSMNPNVSYCTTSHEDAVFGAQYDAYRYRWTCSCLAFPDFEPEDLRKAVLSALACSTTTNSPFLVVLILPAWEDSPWITHSILSHLSLTTLAHLNPNQLNLVPPHKQLDDIAIITLSRATECPIDIIISQMLKERTHTCTPPASNTYVYPASPAHAKIHLEQSPYFPITPLTHPQQ